MKKSLKKRGQKLITKFSRASLKAGEEGKEHLKENLIGRISHIQSIRLLIFEWVLLVSALIMLALAQSFWFGDTYAVDTFVEGGNYTEATIGKIGSLNPLFATTSSEKVLSRLMFATLVTTDYSGHPGPGLADSVKTNEDGSVWTLKLRDNLHWSDGEPITNGDVLYTAELLKNPAVNSIYDSNLDGVTVSETENGEIKFTLKSGYADFISALNFPIVPKHELEDSQTKNLIEDDFSVNPVTSGAFSFNALQSTNVDGENIVYLAANPKYYSGKPMVNSFAIHSYNTKEDLISAMNSGVVTATAELSGPETERVTSMAFNKKFSSVDSGAFAFFNMSSTWLSKAELRKAIRQGIDMDTIRAAAPDTTALNYPILDSQISLNKENLAAIPARDFEAAKASIAQLSADGQIHLDVATVNSGYLPEVAEAFANSLRELGIDVSVTSYPESQEFVTNIISRRNFDVLIYEVELGSDPDPLAYYHSSQANASGLNLSNYRNSLVDDLLVGARESLDNDLRARKYETFINYWVGDVPAIGLYQPNLTYIYNKNVRPYNNDIRLITSLDRFSDIEEWAAAKGTKNKTP